MKIENLEEGWVKFKRLHCAEGWIDIWRGDSADDPNRMTPRPFNLNSTSTWYRLNESLWRGSRDFTPEFHHDILEYGEEFTAAEIYYDDLFMQQKRMM